MSQWKVLSSRELVKSGFFRLRVDECELPDGRVMPRYYVMEFPDWVNVVPITEDGKMLLLRQYRHGAGLEFLEIPGGGTHPGVHEDPREAAARELREETGYESSEWIALPVHFPNPALQNNRMHTFVAFGCRKVGEPTPDPFEDFEVIALDVRDAVARWRKGELAHSLISNSLALSLDVLAARGFKVYP